jgi:phage-related holin
MKDKLKKLCSTAIFQCVAIAIVLDIILEILGRHSFINTMKYIVNEPLVFLYNCSIIFFTLTLVRECLVMVLFHLHGCFVV